jgi:hypothetical protein
MSIESPCKIEFIPDGGAAITLVDIGGWLASLPSFRPEQELFETGGINAGESYFKPLGGVLVDITFSVEIEHEEHSDALDDFSAVELAGAVELMKVDGALVVTGPNSSATYEPAVLTVTPGLPFAPVSTTTKTYQIRAALPVIAPLP